MGLGLGLGLGLSLGPPHHARHGIDVEAVDAQREHDHVRRLVTRLLRASSWGWGWGSGQG